jgi:hypothetical protein
MRLTRRRLIAASVVGAGLGMAPRGFSQEPTLGDWEDDLYFAQLEDQGYVFDPVTGRGPPQKIKDRVMATFASGDPSHRVTWAVAEASHPDVAHLPDLPSDRPDSATFKLNASTLKALCAANDFAPIVSAKAEVAPNSSATASTRVLIGIRGCELVGASPANGLEIELREAVPDHKTRKCVLGVWDTETGEIFACSGSTVPNRMYVLSQAFDVEVDSGQPLTGSAAALLKLTRQDFGACAVMAPDASLMKNKAHGNMMPTGLHTFTVGTHLAGKKYDDNGSTSRRDVRQPAVFRQRSLYPTLRHYGRIGATDVAYSFDSFWDLDPRSFGNNMHAAYPPPRHGHWDFDSAGCQTIEGAYSNFSDPNGHRKPAIEAGGQFAALRLAAGLTETPRFLDTPTTWHDSLATHDDGNIFFGYILVSGKEMHLHSIANGEAVQKLRRLRIGSRGPAVRALTRALRGLSCSFYTGPEKDVFDYRVATSVINWQNGVNGGNADGVVTPDIAKELGFEL